MEYKMNLVMTLRGYIMKKASGKCLIYFISSIVILAIFKVHFDLKQATPPILKDNSPGGFSPLEPKIVLIVANQRTGSTLTAQMIQKNPNTFYMFEPADALYQAMYGTQPGLNVPTDIFFNPDGSKREIPIWENKYIADSLGSLMHCDFYNIPIEVLVHPYLNVGHAYFAPSLTVLAPYIKCLEKNCSKCMPKSNRCHQIIRRICPRKPRFFAKKQQMCHKYLKTHKSNKKGFTKLEIISLLSYRDCLLQLKASVYKNCLPILKNICEKTRIRAVKTIRISMETAEYMIEKYRNVRVIHLIRDPRAVALSRDVEPLSMYGMFSGSNKTKEGYLYCQQVLHDIEIKKRIESKYPGTVLTVIYDQLLEAPIKMAIKIYSFINEDIPKDVLKWIMNKRSVLGRAAERSGKWKDKFTYRDANSIKYVCSSLFHEVQDIYNWV